MSSETRTINMTQKFCQTFSEVSLFLGKVKKTIDFFANDNSFRAVWGGLLRIFGKWKKTAILQLSEDQICAVWKGQSKQCLPGFSVIPAADTTVLLYQDGKPVELSPNETDAIYPFSATPQKKDYFWKPRAASMAEVVCVQDRECVFVRWGTPSLNHILVSDKKTQQMRSGIARGQLYLTVTDPKRLYEKLLCNGPKTEEALQDYLRNVFINGTKIQLFRIFEKLSADTSDVPDTLRQMELAEEFYEATKDTFKDYGMEMDARTKHTILLSMTLKTHEATPNPISRGGGFLI